MLLLLILLITVALTTFPSFAFSLSFSSPSTTSSSSSSSCSNVLFVTFHEGDERARFALSRDGRRFRALYNNAAIPALQPSISGTTVRDPFVGAQTSPFDKLYHMVSTNGGGSSAGESDTFLHWSSPDLLTWSTEERVPILQQFNISGSANLWAPEFVYDEGKDDFLIFFALSWQSGHEQFADECDNPNMGRYAFWGTHTKDFKSFSKPELVYDPHCFNASFAPYVYGDGGIDGDIVHLGNLYALYFKDSRAPVVEGVGPMQLTSGIRVAYSTDLVEWTTAVPGSAQGTELIGGFYGTEGPEVMSVNGTSFLYFDCTFQPTPKGWARPPYGLAVSTQSVLGTQWQEWEPIVGSCTGNSTTNPDGLDFPDGSTHGSFLCIDDETYDALVSKWGW